jgi:transcriptional regulator with XRE-family HTH domain
VSEPISFRRQLHILINARRDVPTLRQLSEAIDTSQHTLMSLLSGRTAYPRLETARRLCDYFGVSLNYFGLTTEAACWHFLADSHAHSSDVLDTIRAESDALSPTRRAELLPIVERIRRAASRRE